MLGFKLAKASKSLSEGKFYAGVQISKGLASLSPEASFMLGFKLAKASKPLYEGKFYAGVHISKG